MMKKLLALLLAVMLVMGCLPALADSDVEEFDPSLTKRFNDLADFGPEGWHEKSGLRALLTVVLFVDYLSAVGGDAADYDITKSYLGYAYNDGMHIYELLVQQDDGDTHAILYAPEYGIANHVKMFGDVDSVADTLNGNPFKLIKNNAADINSAATDLAEAMAD